MKNSTEQDYRRRVARVAEAILADPAADHSAERLAELANFSPYHFRRIYYAISGGNLAVTVRRARLALAAQRLSASRVSITTAAEESAIATPPASRAPLAS